MRGAPPPPGRRSGGRRGGLLTSRPFRWAELVVNLFLLGVCVTVASLLVLTAVPAWAAAFAVMRDWRRLGDSAVVMPFLRHLRSGLRLAVLTIPLVAVAAIALVVTGVLPQVEPEAIRAPILAIVWLTTVVVWTVVTVSLLVWVHDDAGVGEAVGVGGRLLMVHPVLALVTALTVVAVAAVTVLLPPLVVVVIGPGLYAIHSLAAPLLDAEDADD